MSKFTPTQEEAINVSGNNVLISAGAGSGKTAVLTERVYRLIANRQANLSEILVLTFTNAAAHEMKERIRQKLSADLQTNKLAADVDSAFIMTFDAYALYLVKKYHLNLYISADVDIADTSIFEIEKRRIIDQVFEAEYANPTKEFATLIRHYCHKNDRAAKQYVLAVIHTAELQLHPEIFLTNYTDYYEGEKFFNDAQAKFHQLFSLRMQEITELLNLIESDEETEVLKTVFADFNPQLPEAFAIRLINKFAIPRIKKEATDNDKLHLEQIRLIINELNDMAPLLNQETTYKAFQEASVDRQLFLQLANKAIQQLNEFKHRHNLYDFPDIAKMALHLLDDDSINQEIRQSLKYIMVDEYQDTSDLQEAFLTKIAHNNLYMVGDIKQSIYRFRNANSDIFAAKYAAYAQHQGGLKIDMNRNFRSRRQVLEDINLLFGDLMSPTYGGAAYRPTHLIEFGNQAYEAPGNDKENAHIDIYTYASDKDKRADIQEREVRLIAEDIINKISMGYQILPKGTNKARSVMFADFAILIDRKSRFDLFQKVFDEYHIPLAPESDQEIASSDVVMAVRSLIQSIGGILYPQEYSIVTLRHAFMSVARSFIFSIKDRELDQWMQTDSWQQSPVYKELAAIAQAIVSLPLDFLLSELFRRTKIYEKLILVGDIRANTDKLDQLVSLASTMARIGRNLQDFIVYFDELAHYEVSFAVSSLDKATQAVRLMSIHKSKGLEFPIVYYPHLFNRFNTRESSEKMIADNQYGLLLPDLMNKNGMTIFHFLIRDRDISADISEKVRLFYVALTRAREKIILLTPADSKGPINLRRATSFADFLTFFTHRGMVKEKLVSCATTIPTLIKKDQSNQIWPLKITDFNYEFNYQSAPPIAKERANEVDFTALEYGEKLHRLLETADFIHKKIIGPCTDKERAILFRVLNLPLFSKVDATNLYREYSFYDENSGHEGIIDGFILYSDHIDLFDYKLRHIDDKAYLRQLTIYSQYLTTIFKLPVEAYLISILEGKAIHQNLG